MARLPRRESIPKDTTLKIRLSTDDKNALTALAKKNGYNKLSSFIRDIPKMLDENTFLSQLKLVMRGVQIDPSDNFPYLKIKTMYYLMCYGMRGLSFDDLGRWVKKNPYDLMGILREFKEAGYVDFYRELDAQSPSEQDIRVVRLKAEGKAIGRGLFSAVRLLSTNKVVAQQVSTSHKGGFGDLSKIIPASFQDEKKDIIKAIKFIYARSKYSDLENWQKKEYMINNKLIRNI